MAKSISRADYYKNSPRRSPRWRYERARSLLDAKQSPNRRDDDEETITLWRFIRDWDALGKGTRSNLEAQDKRWRLFLANPGLYYAYEMYQNAEQERDMFAVEARILARQTDAEIAKESCVSSETITWLESAFFNVRDRLDNRDYITSKVISPAVQQGWENITNDMTAKFFGYFGGPLVLDTVLHAFNGMVVKPTSMEGVDSFLTQHFMTQMNRRAATLVNNFGVDRYTIMPFLDINTKLLELSHKSKTETGDLSTMEKAVALLLETLPIASGDRRKAALEQSPVSNYYNQAGELRTHEILALQQGDTPESVNEIPGLTMRLHNDPLSQ